MTSLLLGAVRVGDRERVSPPHRRRERDRRQVRLPLTSLASPLPALLALAMLGAGACSGGVSGTSPGATGGSGPGSGGTGSGGTGGLGGGGGTGGGGPGTGGASACQAAPKIPQRLWRLSMDQYGKTLRDLLQLPTVPLVVDTGTSADAFFSDDTQGVDYGLTLNVYQAVQAVMTTVKPRIAQLVGCRTGEAETACAQRFVQSFGARGFRRALTETETADLMAVYNDSRTRAEDFNTAMGLVIEAVIQSPSLLYRTELGTPTAAAGSVTALKPAEVATQLAFFLTDTAPDADLLAAAAAGGLDNEAGIAEQVDRLLALDATKRNISRIVMGWFNVRQYFAAAKDPGYFDALPAADRDQAVIRADLLQSVETFVDTTLWSGRVDDLLTSRKLFVNRRLALLYGLPATGLVDDRFVPLETPEGQRAGIVSQPAVIWANSDVSRTSIVHRGIFVHNEITCADPVPSPGDLLSRPDIVAKLAMLPTEIDKSNYRLSDGGCRGCHTQIDPYGLVLEGFDPAGRARTVADGLPVQNTAMFEHLSPSLNGTLTGPQAFAQAVVNDKLFSGCAIQKMTSYVLGRMIRTYNTCELAQVRDRFNQSDGTVGSLFREVAIAGFLRTRIGGVK